MRSLDLIEGCLFIPSLRGNVMTVAIYRFFRSHETRREATEDTGEGIDRHPPIHSGDPHRIVG